ncbi:hypothetical protein F5I97DRAFT_2024174 [Phlebopus sp. FC_14]|nr:hypothetical protein F5I97DRAFT_2024174 [Phlebopus sp. FC_14]
MLATMQKAHQMSTSNQVDGQTALRNKTFVSEGIVLPPPSDELLTELDGLVNEDDVQEENRSDIPVNETLKNVTPDSPYHLWPSKAFCMLAVLQTSKKCNPGLEGACDVPSLYSLQKVIKSICDTVGNPSEKTTSRSGNVFYINNIGKAIAKDYANPLTCFAIQDYPKDKGSGILEVFYGKKILLDLPSPPTARIHGKVYFVNEILQEISGEYFFPE